MTRGRSFKARVRSRMGKTGESYTAARRQLLERSARPPGHDTEHAEPATPPPAGRGDTPAATSDTVSDERVRAATGRGRQEWFALLDAWDAARRTHTEIARWLTVEHGVPGWWAQSVTVSYEQARGLRVPGQASDGRFRTTCSRTVNVSVERLFEAFADPGRRARWLVGELTIRTATAPRSLRADWLDGRTRIYVTLSGKGDAKSVVALEHDRLSGPDEVAESKAFWRSRLAALKSELEASPGTRERAERGTGVRDGSRNAKDRVRRDI
ncbi:DUF4287 domain-containing protein [Wenjunlia vitaminophila]|uniref:DUF4287 domain-containing protein n=1 Tax=Wenjunlia vitaminophila TaxID=76728 RepID=UPI0003796105|nr:DUF4287 domain-containing protein [Wenjunlia vitaminophila]